MDAVKREGAGPVARGGEVKSAAAEKGFILWNLIAWSVFETGDRLLHGEHHGS